MEEIIRIETPTPFGVGTANSFLIKGDTLSIIDVGTKFPPAYEALEAGLKAQNYRFEDIEQVILTHHHPDHIGWTDAFVKADVIGHAYNDYWLRRDKAFFDYQRLFYKEQLAEEGVPQLYNRWVDKMIREVDYMGTTPLSTIIKDGDTLPGHPNLVAVETLGHAQSHLMFVDEKARYAFGGDLLIDFIASNPLVEVPMGMTGPRPKSQLQYNDSLKKLASYDFERVYSGHGNVITNATELAATRLEKQHQRAMRAYALIDAPLSVFEITKRFYPTKMQAELGLTLSSTLGQLDYLEDQGLVVRTLDEEGVARYEQV